MIQPLGKKQLKCFVVYAHEDENLKEIFWEDLKHARRIYQKRAILEDDGRGTVSVRRLHGPGVVTGAVQGVKEKVISPITRRLSDQNEEEDLSNENESRDVSKADNIAAN